jgi:hypothetical protein
MAPLSTKAIIFKDSDMRAPRAPHGLDAWMLGPSKDHYRCHVFYVPELKGYQVLGSANLFPQHCMAPKHTPKLHVKELSEELHTNLKKMACKYHNIKVMKTLHATLMPILLALCSLPPNKWQNKGWWSYQHKG